VQAMLLWLYPYKGGVHNAGAILCSRCMHEFYQAELREKDLSVALADVYAQEARFCCSANR